MQTIDIIKVANGLETVRGQFNGKLHGVTRETCNAKRACLMAMDATVKSQLSEIYKSREYATAWKQLTLINKPNSDFLKATSGLNGAQILSLTTKSVA